MINELKQERSREPISQVKDIEVLHYNPFPVTPIKPISIKGFWVTERPPFPFTYFSLRVKLCIKGGVGGELHPETSIDPNQVFHRIIES